jgi:putative CocE/NonD family hydrolase
MMPTGMTHPDSPPHAVREIENAWITLSDGCRVGVRLWLPADADGAPVPAILEYIPYRKRDFMRRRDEGMHRWFAGHGYACVRVDMRGSGESEGTLDDEYLLLEQDDALEIIAWIARQRWCSGAVGMMGKSWGAYNALQVAARRPAALKAIVAVMGTDDRFAECIHYSGGCLLNDNFWWGCIMQVFNARPPDPEIVGERWRAMWLERLEAERFWPEIWLEHQTLDEYWRHGSVRFDYEAIACPTWFWGGWADLYRDTPFRLAKNLKIPHKVTMGPWAHLYPHEGAPAPAVGFLQEALRWWDRWLKGKDDGLANEAPLRFYMMDGVAPAPSHAERPGRWIEETQWPSPRIATVALAIDAEGLRRTASAERALKIDSPQTTGLAGGDWGSFGIAGDLPGDQRLDSFGSLELDSEPLDKRVEILGNVRARLDLAADQPYAFVAVRLIDVAPDGRAACVARGFLNLRHRDSREAPSAIVPGERCRVDVELTGTAYAFAAGHRIRLALSNAYWPILWPSPQAAAVTLYAGASQLLLPVREPEPAGAESRPLPPPASAAASPTSVVRPGRIERAVTLDQLSGEVTHRLYIDGGVFGPSGKFRLEDIGVELAHVFERIYRIKPGEPNSAHATMNQTYETARGDWRVRIEAGAKMTSTVSTFELHAWIEAYESDRSILRKDWSASIPRVHV